MHIHKLYMGDAFHLLGMQILASKQSACFNSVCWKYNSAFVLEPGP